MVWYAVMLWFMSFFVCDVQTSRERDNCSFPFYIGTPMLTSSLDGVLHMHLTFPSVDFSNGDQAVQITASLALNVASNTLLFVAYTTNTGNYFLTRVSIITAKTKLLI